MRTPPSPPPIPRPAPRPLNGRALDAWILFDIAVPHVVTGLRRLAMAMFGLYFATAVIERTVTGAGAAFIIVGIVSTIAAYALLTLHFHIGRRIHFRPPVKMTS